MDIRKILKENAFGTPMAYSHLSPLHVGILKKIAKNEFDPDVASPKAQAVLSELIEFGLVNDIDYSITEDGIKALKYAEKLGGSVERRQAMANKEKAFNNTDNTEFEDSF